MTLYQIDFQARMLWPRSDSDWYYWTNTFFAECATILDAYEAVGVADNFLRTVTRRTVFDAGLRWGIAPGPDPIIFQGPSGNEPGYYGQPGQVGTLGNAVLLQGLAGGKVVSYKRLMLPLMPDEIGADGLIVPDVLSWFGSAALTLLPVQFTNAAGTVIEEYRVKETPHLWQPRHGTKRRSRAVFAI